MSLIRFMPPRGTGVQCATYVGTLGELFTDTTAWQLRVSDGATPGGHVQGGISNLIGCSDVGIGTGPALARGQHLRYLSCAPPVQSNIAGSTTGGTLGAATRYYVVTALNSNGETLASNEKSVVNTGTTSSNVISWAAVAEATGYRVYRGTAAGVETAYYAPGNVLTYTDTNAASTAGSPPGVDSSSKWVNAALPWGDLTGQPTTLAGYGITDAALKARLVSTGSGLTGGGDLTADRTLSIVAHGVTNAMRAQMAANTIRGNNTGSTADVADLTTTQVKSLLAIASTDVSGLATSATTDTTNAANISAGTLAAGRMPALTGDVTTASGAVATTIAAAAVTLAKMANLAANSMLGNNTGSAATPIALTLSQVKTWLGLVASATTDTTNASNITSGTLGAAEMPALTGDVTTVAGAVATTIGAGKVTLAMHANLAANSIMGNNTGSAAVPLALTAAQTKTLLAIASGDVSGLAASATTDTTNASNISSGTLSAARHPGIPITSKTAAYTLVAADHDTCISITTGGITVNNAVHAAGDSICIYNDSASTQTITQGASLTMRLGGTATTGSRTLAIRGQAILWFKSSSEVIVQGSVS